MSSNRNIPPVSLTPPSSSNNWLENLMAGHHPFETTVTLSVPHNLYPAGSTAEGHEEEWVIEVWGKVSGGVDFTQSYLVQIF